MSKIELKGVQKKYPGNDRYSVVDFNLEIDPGEFIVLVGPSGCGKSTTLRMIAGLEDITEGDFLIDGVRVNDMSAKDRDIAMVFQSYALYPHMSVRDNMGYGLKLRKVPKPDIRKRVENIAADLGLEEYLARKPKNLSGGQRQRVALGRAMIRTPQMYLMDEPLSNLDAKLRVSTRTEISRLHRAKGAVTIYVTHDQVEAMTMADRIVLMSMGKIQQVGTPKDLFNHPKNRFVATFMGMPPMNISKGVYKGEAFHSESFIIKLSQGDCTVLNRAGYQGKEILMGVRANAIKYDEIYKDTYPDAVIQAKVLHVEFLGEKQQVFFEAPPPANMFVASVSPSVNIEVDHTIALVLETTKLHFFDPETEESIKYHDNIDTDL